MSDMHISRLEPEALNRVAEALMAVGVAGNEGDRRFDAHVINASRAALEERLRETGYAGGSLSIGTLAQPHDETDVLVYDTDRYQAVMLAEQAWKQDYQTRWHDIVQNLVEDWLVRLLDLRAQMVTWIQESPELSTLTFVDLPPAIMSEELMQRFAVRPREMLVFELRAGSSRVMRFQPKGLWIIGANGRVDLITKAAAPILVDKSQPFARPSEWRLYDPGTGNYSVPLTAELFDGLVRAGLR